MLSMKEIKKRLTVRSPFPEKEFESLLSKGTELRFKPRTPIVGPGVADDRIFLIKKGLACGVYRAKGREHTIYFAFPGDIIGSTAGLCLGKPTSISIETFTNTVVTAIPILEVIRMAAASTEFVTAELESGAIRELKTDFEIPPRSVDMCTLRDVPPSAATARFTQEVARRVQAGERG